ELEDALAEGGIEAEPDPHVAEPGRRLVLDHEGGRRPADDPLGAEAALGVERQQADAAVPAAISPGAEALTALLVDGARVAVDDVGDGAARGNAAVVQEVSRGADASDRAHVVTDE